MTNLIETSINDSALSTDLNWRGKVTFRFQIGWKARSYTQDDIKEINEIEEETFRSGGKAAVGAIIGGVLTGGIGLIAGAAIGGRRRSEATYLIHFTDGEYVAFTESKRKIVKALHALIGVKKIREAQKGEPGD